MTFSADSIEKSAFLDTHVYRKLLHIFLPIKQLFLTEAIKKKLIRQQIMIKLKEAVRQNTFSGAGLYWFFYFLIIQWKFIL